MIWHAGDQSNRHYGPSKIRVSSQGDIWVLSHGKLHVFSSLGLQQRTLHLADWKRSSLQSDFYPLTGGDILLAEPDTHEVFRCRPDGVCAPLLGRSRAVAGITKNAMMLAVDEVRQRLYVSDNAGHRLLMFDLDGRLLDDTRQRKSRFWYPNQIELIGGNLLVTDTNHRRIVNLPVSDDRFGVENSTFDTTAAQVRARRTWPMSFVALADGQWWVAIAQEGMRHADVARFDANWRPRGFVAMENDADPVSLVSVGDRILIADTEHYRVRQADRHGHPLPDFGPVLFRQELAALAHTAGNWRILQRVSQVAVIVLPVLAILILWRLGERPSSGQASLSFQTAPAPIQDGETVWISPTSRFVKQQTWFLRAYTVMLVLLSGWGIWLIPMFASFPARAGWLLGSILLFALIPAVYLAILARKLVHNRLGTDGVQLFHDSGDGKVYAFPLAETVSDGQRLMAGQRMIAMRIGPRMIYDRDDLQQWILPRLRSSANISSWRLYIVGLRNGNRAIWWNTIIIAVLIIVWLIIEFGRTWLKPLFLHLLK